MEKMIVYLVDDDEDDRNFFADALNQLNQNTQLFHFENGEQFLQHLKQYPEPKPELVFLDLNMPIMNGIECLERIRSISEFKNLPIAIYSTSSSPNDIEETFTKGANIYINKPESFQSLKRTLKQVLKINWAYRMEDFKKENYLLKL